jgi:hypothetical protein
MFQPPPAPSQHTPPCKSICTYFLPQHSTSVLTSSFLPHHPFPLYTSPHFQSSFSTLLSPLSPLNLTQHNTITYFHLSIHSFILSSTPLNIQFIFKHTLSSVPPTPFITILYSTLYHHHVHIIYISVTSSFISDIHSLSHSNPSLSPDSCHIILHHLFIISCQLFYTRIHLLPTFHLVYSPLHTYQHHPSLTCNTHSFHTHNHNTLSQYNFASHSYSSSTHPSFNSYPFSLPILAFTCT